MSSHGSWFDYLQSQSWIEIINLTGTVLVSLP